MFIPDAVFHVGSCPQSLAVLGIPFIFKSAIPKLVGSPEWSGLVRWWLVTGV